MSDVNTPVLDCLVIGGGPAGLTAAVYLARFRRSLALVDSDESRANHIPLSHNAPGFTEGVDGRGLLERHRRQAATFGVQPIPATVTRLSKEPEGTFSAEVRSKKGDSRMLRSRTVLVATGSVDQEPALPDVEQAIFRGLVRHCPICDGYEVIGENIAVIGYGKGGIGEAIFMRTYSDKVTLLTLGREMHLDEEDRRKLKDAGIALVEEPVARLFIKDGKISCLQMKSGAEHRFDTLYSALGAHARADLLGMLGAELDDPCYAVVVDQHQKTSIEGVWAAGDVASSLNQISVAWGQAAIAATDIHNTLRRIDAEKGIYGPSAPAGPDRVDAPVASHA